MSMCFKRGAVLFRMFPCVQRPGITILVRGSCSMYISVPSVYKCALRIRSTPFQEQAYHSARALELEGHRACEAFAFQVHVLAIAWTAF